MPNVRVNFDGQTTTVLVVLVKKTSSKQSFLPNSQPFQSKIRYFSHSQHFEVLASGRCDLHCKIKETLFIRDLKPTLNDNVGSEKLWLYYLSRTFCFHYFLISYQYLAFNFKVLNLSFFVTVTSEDACCRMRNVK